VADVEWPAAEPSYHLVVLSQSLSWTSQGQMSPQGHLHCLSLTQTRGRTPAYMPTMYSAEAAANIKVFTYQECSYC